MKLGLSVFWLPYSDPQSKPLTHLLTNVLIVSVKYTMLPPVHRNVNVLIEPVSYIRISLLFLFPVTRDLLFTNRPYIID